MQKKTPMANKVNEQVERKKPLITPPQKKPLPAPAKPVLPIQNQPNKKRLND